MFIHTGVHTYIHTKKWEFAASWLKYTAQAPKLIVEENGIWEMEIILGKQQIYQLKVLEISIWL